MDPDSKLLRASSYSVRAPFTIDGGDQAMSNESDVSPSSLCVSMRLILGLAIVQGGSDSVLTVQVTVRGTCLHRY